MKTSIRYDTRKLVLLAMLTALVVLLQFLGAFIKFGTFSISLVMLPIVVGSALIGASAGAWLGLVFGCVVFASGDANVFFAIHPAGTVLTVLIKGIGAGYAAGVTHKALTRKNKTAAVIAAAIVAPVVNTGIFLIGSCVFFLPTITAWASEAGFASVTAFIFIVLIGGNFIVELALNLIVSPVIVRLIQFGRASFAK